ncbi:biopolymer transport protein ExbD [Amphritea atlantica]|uniref:Biopolymer transport protein ExbD n=1 Tax=Amphritea atlantica TaxID=355243 RepID=A0A1H9HAB2_9GAMM|nr:biopolymer transporter ExbD [Amphritea atlantica]SEQ59275.1 biopolymer transport protein ExbD [Amphritea atlantica]
MLLEITPRASQSISLTPLIDVVFILLLFFMLSSTFSKTRQLELEATSPGTQNLMTEVNRLLLLTENRADLNGTIYTVDSTTFSQQLSAIANADGAVTLAAHPTVRVQQTIHIIDSLRAAGIVQLDLSPSVSE